ncbi:unnamed protein product [Cuscuta epithymum]|uniref:F-box associated beta-propeller type 1 domain-containing protein n=1 Tax=Cuscuta epithymum TaxID=186058 RepID=A0AAV0DYE8_9ASTE|nr:unnamed protein product [Cuscuta epithymum]
MNRNLCSCNGLVLLAFGKHIILWNPLIRRSTKVLELQRLQMFKPGGLCYDPTSKDYKVVLLLFQISIIDNIGVQYAIFSGLKNKGWRKLSFPFKFCTSPRAGVNFNNTLHWIVRHAFMSPSFSPVDVDMVIYYDPVDDAFERLPTPRPNCSEEDNYIDGTQIIEGCFCLGQRNEERKTI